MFDEIENFDEQEARLKEKEEAKKPYYKVIPKKGLDAPTYKKVKTLLASAIWDKDYLVFIVPGTPKEIQFYLDNTQIETPKGATVVPFSVGKKGIGLMPDRVVVSESNRKITIDSSKYEKEPTPRDRKLSTRALIGELSVARKAGFEEVVEDRAIKLQERNLLKMPIGVNYEEILSVRKM